MVSPFIKPINKTGGIFYTFSSASEDLTFSFNSTKKFKFSKYALLNLPPILRPTSTQNFIQLDDNDIWTALKVWSNHSDVVLSTLSRGMINRKLFKVEVTSSSITKARKEEILSRISKRLNINKKEAKYFLSISSIENNMYKKEDDSIEIIYKDGSTRDIAKASDMLNISLLSRKVKKYYICYLRSENDGH